MRRTLTLTPRDIDDGALSYVDAVAAHRRGLISEDELRRTVAELLNIAIDNAVHYPEHTTPSGRAWKLTTR